MQNVFSDSKFFRTVLKNEKINYKIIFIVSDDINSKTLFQKLAINLVASWFFEGIKAGKKNTR
jgi:hypothetical protein